MNNPLYKLLWNYIDPPCLTKPFWGAIAMAGVSLIQGSQASKDAARASGSQMSMEQAKLDFATQQYDDYKTTYGGLEEDLVASIEEFSDRENLGKYTREGVADVRSAYGKAEEMGARQMTRYGIDPGDERFIQQSRGADLEQAKSEIVARNVAREKVESDEDKLFAQRIALGQFGKGMPQQAAGVTSAMGSMATSYGREAEGYAQQAGSAYGLAGQSIGMATKQYSPDSGTSDPVWEGSNYVTDADVGELGW